MFEAFILGLVQGIAEWLPISSEAMVVLIKNNFFSTNESFSDMISFAIFLHTGTLLAVLVYYRKKITSLLSKLFSYKQQNQENRSLLNFIILVSIVSGILGVFLLKIVHRYESFFENEFMINIAVAIFLSITALFLFLAEQKEVLNTKTVLNTKKSLIVGLFQGLAAIPGISRSGSTIAGMGILGIPKKQALELSFLLSVPLVFGANIVLNLAAFATLNAYNIIALCSAFIFGLLSIEFLLRLVEKIKFSYFVAIFAVFLFITNILLF